MPFLQTRKNDVFVSYAHIDNLDDIEGQKCVSLIVRQLRTILQQRLSRDGLEVFWDQSHLGANRTIDSALEGEVAASGVMVAIVSPAYQSGTHTIAELEAFMRQPGAEDRLFLLEILPSTDEDEVHPVIGGRKRFEFWHMVGDGESVPMTFDPKLDRQAYMTRLTDFCSQIRDRLVAMKRAEVGGAAAPRAATAEPVATVLLAQTTDDLDFELGQMRTALQQFNVRVLPAMDYPQGGREFREAFAADLAQADIVVQLLGRSPGRMPADMPNGYLSFQCEAAVEQGTPLACWRHPEIDPATVDNPIHSALLTGPEVMATGLEAFKTHVMKLLEARNEPQRPARSSLVFIGADRSDMPFAEELLGALSKRGLPVAVPIYEGTPEDIQRDLEENLIDSDSVLFVHGAAPATWVRGFLRRVGRSMALRAAPLDYHALVKAPPPKAESLNHAFPNLEIIDCSERFDVDRIVAALEARL